MRSSGRWWSLSVSFKSWWFTSSKTFLRSSNVIIQRFCFNWALLIICVSVSMCSAQSETFSQKPFWRFDSIYSFVSTNWCILFRITDGKIIDNKCCSVIGRKFSSSFRSPFLQGNTVTPDCQAFGKVLIYHANWLIFVRCELSIGYFLNAITLTWSREHGNADDFILDMILVISV